MTQTDVVFTLAGDVRHNSRAIKQLRLLRSLGLTVTIFALGQNPGVPFPGAGVQLNLLPRPSASGPRFFWNVHRMFLQAARNVPARVYHASDLYSLPAMRLAAKIHRSRLVYDARELYSHVAATAGRPWVRAFWFQAERRNIGATHAVFTVSDSIADRLSRSYRIARPAVLHNVPDMQHPLPAGTLRVRAGVDNDTVLILHQGHVQRNRGCFALVDAMHDIHGAAAVFMGGGSLMASLKRAVRERGLDMRVRFVDPVPPDELLPVTADADLGVTLLEDTCLNHRYALPNKLFEYLMAGVPVLASDLREMRAVVQDFNVGMVVHPSDRTALVRTLQRCVDDAEARQQWSINAAKVFDRYSWAIASERFTTAYRKLLA